MPRQLSKKLLRFLCHRLVDVDADVDQARDDLLVVDLRDVLDEVCGNRAQGLLGPLREPVDGAARHKAGKLAKTGPEDLSYGTGGGRGGVAKRKGREEKYQSGSHII